MKQRRAFWVSGLGAVSLVLGMFVNSSLIPVKAAPPVIGGIGIMGDSFSDEYRADNNRAGGTPYAATTLNWMEILAKAGYNFGAWGTWGEPRRTGYEYNWAHSGILAHDVITSGQHLGLASQVTAGKVQNVVFQIGANDFAGAYYNAIYTGTMTDAQVTAKVNAIVADMTTAVDTVLAAGSVRMVVATLADRGNQPAYIRNFPDPAKRQRVSNAVISVNQGITSLATARGIAISDLYNFGNTLFSQLDAAGNYPVAGELISLAVSGDEPHHFLLADAEHVGTVMSGLIANMICLDVFASFYGLPLQPITQTESLQYAGITPPAPLASFTATPAVITPGSAATLSWNATHSDSASIDNGIGAVSLSGSVSVNPESTTTYTLVTKKGPYVVERKLVTVVVSAEGGPTNQAPVVTVGANQIITLPASATVSAQVSDDGLPANALTTTWSQVSGPAQANIVSPASVQTTVSFSVAGTYVFRMDSSDGELSSSGDVQVTVHPASTADTTAPTVSITSPTAGQIVSGVLTITASASDNVGVARVDFFSGSVMVCRDTVAPYTCSGNTALSPDGIYTLTAKAFDAAGNSNVSTAVQITVKNH